VIVCDLEEPLICSLAASLEAIEIRPIVPNMGCVGLCTQNKERCYGYNLVGLLALVVLIQATVGLLHTFSQQTYNSLRFK